MSELDAKKLTPVMRQHAEAKAAYPDALVFFRLGDFYELFGEDAVTASSLLGLTLTARNKGAPDEIPMAGVPYHAAHNHVAKLLSAGHKIAICEQLADPSTVKGIVPREVVRVLTPGLVTDTEQLDARTNHFLAAVEEEAGGAHGLALLDLSTAELGATGALDAITLVAELARAEPRELLVPEGAAVAAALRAALPKAAFRTVPRQLDEPERELAGLRGSLEPLAARAAARALRFARACNPTARLPIEEVRRLDPSSHLAIDETAQVHLELVRSMEGTRRGSLLDVIDATVTPGGARLLRRRLLAPLRDVRLIRERLDQVERFVTNPAARDELRAALAAVGDLDRLATRVALREATPRDLGGLRDGLLAVPQALAAVRSLPSTMETALVPPDLDPLQDLASRLARTLVPRPPPIAREGGVIAEGVDAELDEQRRLRTHATELVAALEEQLRRSTGVSSLKVRFTRNFGWYVEVTKANLSKVPAGFRRKQTVAQGERYTTPELDDLADRIQHAETRELERELELWGALVADTAARVASIRVLAATLASWDCAAALADVAHRAGYCRPDVDDGEVIELEAGRHPVVERLAAAGRFVPNDVRLDLGGERFHLITGPNMAGKSTLMRQIAISVLLAQAGSFVPAARARIGVVDRVLSRVGASDNVSRGESTFMVEMRETARILRDATRRSLVILDEIGRGTSTYDGLSIAWAVAEHLHEVVRCRALFATHYHELTELARESEGMANYSVSAREHEGDVVFLHKVVPGPASRSYGVAVARLAGLPAPVLARAEALLGQFEGTAGGRGKRRAGPSPQLDLFARGAPPEPRSARPPDPLLEELRALPLERTTPLDALRLLADLRERARKAHI